MPKHPFTALAVMATTTALLGAAPVNGADSRKVFVEKVDPICKRTQKQAAGILNGADSNFELGKAYAVIARKARAAFSDIYRIGPAPSDLVIFDRWIQKLQRENAIVVRLSRSLKDGKTGKAKVLMQKATDADKRGEKVVRDFGFRYCDRSEVGTP